MARESDRSISWIVKAALVAYAKNSAGAEVERRPAVEVRA